MLNTAPPRRHGLDKTPAGGFSLIELAVVIAVIALLIGSIMVPLQTQVEARKIEETKRMLEQAREALLGYAAAYGYFPCPASATSNGGEPAGTDHATGACPSYFGFLPAQLLGVNPVDADGFAVDPWTGTSTTNASRIRYAIASDTIGTVTAPFTRSGGMAAATIANVGAQTYLLHVCGSATGVNGTIDCGSAANTLTTRAVFVVWSSGANAATGGGASADEAQNPNPAGGSADRIFVSRSKSTVTGAEFDDILLWTSPVVVLSRLVAAGTLP